MYKLLFSAFLLISNTTLFSQITYVDASVQQPGDGSSWTTAYRDLAAAIAGADAGAELWIAQGRYTTPADGPFRIDRGLTLRGGFRGGESRANQADPSRHQTILSGDVLGNDPVNRYDSLAFSDNQRVLFLAPSANGDSLPVHLDGLTVTNGAVAAAYTGASILPFSGGGILATTRFSASRLLLRKNRAEWGAAVAILSASAEGSICQDIKLENNYSAGSSQFYLRDTENILIEDATFIGSGSDTLFTGAVSAYQANEITFRNSRFANYSVCKNGGGIWLGNCDDVLVENCSFDDIIAGHGGGVYMATFDDYVTERVRDEKDFVIRNSTFVNCRARADLRGGAVFAFNCNLSIAQSAAAECASGSVGGAYYYETAGDGAYRLNLSEVILENNSSRGAGGAMCVLALGTTEVTGQFTKLRCQGNRAERRGAGGAISYECTGSSSLQMRDCDFIKNVGAYGTVLVAGPVDTRIEDSNFLDNGEIPYTAHGGGIAFYATGSPGIRLDNCAFIGNRTDRDPFILSGGGGIYLFADDTETMVPLSVVGCKFSENRVEDAARGGGMYLINSVDLQMDNCEFASNFADGPGGAIYKDVNELARSEENGETSVTYGPAAAQINNSCFLGNRSDERGGAIATLRASLNAYNSVFAGNRVSTFSDAESGSGGAVSTRGNAPQGGVFDPVTVGSLSLNYVFVHNTFYENRNGGPRTSVGNHLAFQQPGDTFSGDVNRTEVSLANNVFFSARGVDFIDVEPGPSNENGFLAIGDIQITSAGGNFINGTSGEEVVFSSETDFVALDLTVADSLFVRPMGTFDETLSLVPLPTENHPFTKLGVVAPHYPRFDKNGTTRQNPPSSGAYSVGSNPVNLHSPNSRADLQFSLFPNPTTRFLSVRNDGTGEQDYGLQLLDVNGRVVYSGKMNGPTLIMDLSGLSAAAYQLVVLTQAGNFSTTVIKN